MESLFDHLRCVTLYFYTLIFFLILKNTYGRGKCSEYRCVRRPEVSDPLKLEIQAVVSWPDVGSGN